MRAARRKDQQQGEFVTLELSKGVLCIIPVEQYRAGLFRGKMHKRAQRRAKHIARLKARAEAQQLGWIT
jgi:hypothetical protein